jgi:hypothetical protein
VKQSAPAPQLPSRTPRPCRACSWVRIPPFPPATFSKIP